MPGKAPASYRGMATGYGPSSSPQHHTQDSVHVPPIPHSSQPETSNKGHKTSQNRDVISGSLVKGKRSATEELDQTFPPLSRSSSKSMRSSTEELDQTFPPLSKPSKKRKTTTEKIARLAKRRIYQQYHDRRPIIIAYSKCTCDLRDVDWRTNKGALSKAIANNRAVIIVEPDGSFTSHLRSCEYHRPTKRTSYNPHTIARDFLRAVGRHPSEPALNERYVQWARTNWR